jgi:hypothetical protein
MVAGELKRVDLNSLVHAPGSSITDIKSTVGSPAVRDP